MSIEIKASQRIPYQPDFETLRPQLKQLRNFSYINLMDPTEEEKALAVHMCQLSQYVS